MCHFPLMSAYSRLRHHVVTWSLSFPFSSWIRKWAPFHARDHRKPEQMLLLSTMQEWLSNLSPVQGAGVWGDVVALRWCCPVLSSWGWNELAWTPSLCLSIVTVTGDSVDFSSNLDLVALVYSATCVHRRSAHSLRTAAVQNVNQLMWL